MVNTSFFRILLLLFALLVSTSWAQTMRVTTLLPAETFLALGTQGLASHADKLDPFIAEFERLELAGALERLFGGQEDASGETALEGLETEFEGLDALDLLGQEAWVALSASSFNPLPALSLFARLSPEALPKASELIAEGAADAGVETLTEGSYSFYQMRLEDAESPVQVLAYALADDLLMLSSNPDTLRGALRQLGGSSDPNFMMSAGYGATLGQIAEANFYGYLDFAQVANVLAPFAQGFGFDALVTRLISAFNTAGVSSGAVRITADGIENEGLQVPNAEGGDASLYALLTRPTPADTSTIALAPAEALSWSSSGTDLSAWWDYLNEIAASTPELGGDLDSLLQTFVGIDLRTMLFNWAGDQLTTITTGVGEAAQPGVPSSNLLGESVFALSVTDEAAATAGLASLLQTLGATIASFTDPSGGAGATSVATEDIGGASVTTFTMGEGIGLSYTVQNGYAFIGTSKEAMNTVLGSGGASLQDSPAFQGLTASAPAGASGLSLSDNRATLSATAQQIASQLQLTAGLGGAANLDFDAVEAASERLEQFLTFVAERLGFSTSYSVRQDGRIYGFGQTEVSW